MNQSKKTVSQPLRFEGMGNSHSPQQMQKQGYQAIKTISVRLRLNKLQLEETCARER